MKGDPLFKLTVLKMRLRSITNTLLDIGVHTKVMSCEQAMQLMTKTAFQQEREAAGKWTRASLSSTQLLNYFTGYTEHMEMRRRGTATRRRGVRSARVQRCGARAWNATDPVRRRVDVKTAN